MLLERKYDNFESVLTDIYHTKEETKLILGRKEEVEFLVDTSNSIRQWQKKMIADKSDFNIMTLDDLKKKS